MTYILVTLCVILLSSELKLYLTQIKTKKEDFSPLEIVQNQKENCAEIESVTNNYPVVIGKYSFNNSKVEGMLNSLSMRDEEKILSFSNNKALILLVDFKAKQSFNSDIYYPIFIYNHCQHQDYYTSFNNEIVIVEQYQNAAKEWKSLNHFKFKIGGIGELETNECLVILLKKDKSIYLNRRVILKKEKDVVYSLPSSITSKTKIKS